MLVEFFKKPSIICMAALPGLGSLPAGRQVKVTCQLSADLPAGLTGLCHGAQSFDTMLICIDIYVRLSAEQIFSVEYIRLASG